MFSCQHHYRTRGIFFILLSTQDLKVLKNTIYLRIEKAIYLPTLDFKEPFFLDCYANTSESCLTPYGLIHFVFL